MDPKLIQAKNDILSSIARNRVAITKPLLLQLISIHRQNYEIGFLTYENYKLLNNAVSLIWKQQYTTDIEIIFQD